MPIPTLTTDEYKMGWQTNDKVEVKVEVNSVSASDDGTITSKQYLPPTPPPPPPPQVFWLNKSTVKYLKAFLMSKVNITIRKKDTLLEILKEVIVDADTFTEEYSSELVDVTVVTNKANQIQNDVPPIVCVVMTVEE